MNLKKKRKILRQVFHVVGADKIFSAYIVFFIIISIIIWLIDPAITTLGDSLWFCFATATTTGYGDITSISIIGRVLAVVLSIYSIAIVAIFTAVITSYFMEQSKTRLKENVREFIDDLEHLDELSKEELKELSEKVKKFDKLN